MSADERLRNRDQSVVVRLEPMSQEDFEASRDREIPRHAADCVRRGIWTEEAALEASRSEFAELLPQGRETPNRCFFNIVDTKSGSRIGETWYQVREKGGKTHFWIDWIWIEPPFRRRGYATEVLRLLAEEATRRGAEQVGLNVVNDNAEAIALYSKLGYAPTSMHMAKTLSQAR